MRLHQIGPGRPEAGSDSLNTIKVTHASYFSGSEIVEILNKLEAQIPADAGVDEKPFALS